MGQKAILIDLMTAKVEEITVSAPSTQGVDVGIYLDIHYALKNGDVLITELRVPGTPSGKFVPYTCVINGVEGTFKQSCLIVNPEGGDVRTEISDVRKRVKFRKN